MRRGIIHNLIEAFLQAKKSYDEEKRAEQQAIKWTSAATVAIALFTFLNIGVAISQWNAMKGQLREMQFERRAFVFPDDLILEPIRHEKTKTYSWTLLTKWENSGHTPTHNLSGRVCFGDYLGVLDNAIAPRKITFASKRYKYDLGNFFIGPASNISIPTNYVFDVGSIGGMQFEFDFYPNIWPTSKRMKIAGFATYLDDPNGTPRKTRFCWDIHFGSVPDISRDDPGKLEFFKTACSGNCTDEECDRQDESAPYDTENCGLPKEFEEKIN